MLTSKDTSKKHTKLNTIPLLTLQADNIRNVVFAASDESFLESHEDTTPLQSLRTSTWLVSPNIFLLSLITECLTEIWTAASIIAGRQTGLQHSLRRSTVLQASNNLLVFTVFSKVLTSFIGQDPPVRFDDFTEQIVGIVLFAPLLANILIISEKQSLAIPSCKTNLSELVL